jgi:membrane-associated phospholipid phosphatase
MFLTHKNKLEWKWIIVDTLVTVVLVFAGVFWFDIPLYNFLHRFNCGAWNVFDSVFSAKNWLAVSAIVVAVFYIRKLIQTKSKFGITDVYSKIRGSYAFLVFCSVLCAALIGGPLKFIIGRMRPIFYEALNMVGFFPFTKDWAFHSMPSGHALASFAALAMIGMLAPRAKWFTWTLAIVIGISRVCAGAHWPSDVILGAFIGVFAANLTKYILAKRIK